MDKPIGAPQADSSPGNRLIIPLAAGLIALFCGGWALIYIRRYGVSIPFWDEWDLVTAMRQLSDGGLSWGQALLLRNGQHQLFSLFAYSTTAWQLTHLHLKTVMVWNWSIAALFCVLAAVITGHALGKDKRIAWFTLAASSFFVFNPAGYQVIVWAYPPVYSLISLLFFIGVCLAQSKLPAGSKIAGAALVALVASFILGNGLLLWVMLPAVILLYDDFQNLRRSRVALLLFGCLLGLAIAGYIFGAGHNPEPTLSAGLGRDAINIALFFLALTGNFVSLSLSPDPVHLAEGAGALIILLFAIAASAALRGRTGEQRRIVLVWSIFGLFWFLSGLSAALARHQLGVSYPLYASRYVPESSFFLLATLVLAAIALERAGVRVRAFLLSAGSILLVTAIACRYPQTKRSTAVMEELRYRELAGKAAANSAGLIESPAFQKIFPRAIFSEFEADVKFLNGRRWLRPAMWDKHFVDHLSQLTPNSFCGTLDSVTRTANSVNLLGWAYLPLRRQHAHAVIIAGFAAGQPPKLLAVTAAGQPRPDVAAALHSRDAESTGWTIELPATSDAQDYVLQAFAYDAETGETCETQGGRRAP